MNDKKITITPIETRTDTPGLTSRCGPVRHDHPFDLATSGDPADVRAIMLIRIYIGGERINALRDYWQTRERGEVTDDPRLLAGRNVSFMREQTQRHSAQTALHMEYDDMLCWEDNPFLEEVLIEGLECDYLNQRWAKLWMGLLLGAANAR